MQCARIAHAKIKLRELNLCINGVRGTDTKLCVTQKISRTQFHKHPPPRSAPGNAVCLETKKSDALILKRLGRVILLETPGMTSGEFNS